MIMMTKHVYDCDCVEKETLKVQYDSMIDSHRMNQMICCDFFNETRVIFCGYNIDH